MSFEMLRKKCRDVYRWQFQAIIRNLDSLLLLNSVKNTLHDYCSRFQKGFFKSRFFSSNFMEYFFLFFHFYLQTPTFYLRGLLFKGPLFTLRQYLRKKQLFKCKKIVQNNYQLSLSQLLTRCIAPDHVVDDTPIYTVPM